jgi:hypothetical protein
MITLFVRNSTEYYLALALELELALRSIPPSRVVPQGPITRDLLRPRTAS